MSEVATDETLETQVLPDLPVEEESPTGGTQSTETTTTEPETEVEKPDDLRAALTELAGTVNKISQPREEPQRVPTPEEIAAYWKVYDPEATDKEFFKKFGRFGDDATPEQIAAYREMFGGVQKGLMQQAIAAAKNYIAMEREAINAEFGPLKEYVETSKREATRGRFYGEFPALEDKKFQKIIDATARSLDNKTFGNESSYFKALAEGAAESIKAILPEFDLGAKPNKPKPGQTPKLPRTTAGGGGGAGKGAASGLEPTGKKNDIDSLEDGSE